MVKRIFDILFAFLCIVVFSPIIIAVILFIRIKIGSPVFFTQQRQGRYGIPFKIYKFRTMRELFDDTGKVLPDSERMTGFGVFLRKFSLDELPQLFNVLKGELSFIGPRPLLLEYLPLYNDFQKRRLNVMPGITGWAQVNGRNHLSWDEKFKLDVWYVDNQSFWLDLKILLLTVKKIFDHTDISSADHATMPKFTGNSADDE